MRTLIVTLAIAAMLVTGCSGAGSVESPAAQAPAAKPAETQEPRQEAGGVPGPDQICLKPEDASGITFTLARAQSDGGYSAQAGWTIAWSNTQALTWLRFPEPVDRKSVKISVESPDWVYREVAWDSDNQTVPFVIMPKEHAQADPLIRSQGKPGWITLKVEAAKSPEGKELLSAPATLRIFAFDDAIARQHPHIWECVTSLSQKSGSH